MNEREYEHVPNRFPIGLSDFERECLAYLLERHPRNDIGEVIQGAFAKGVAMLVAEERRREGRVVRGHGTQGSSDRHVEPWAAFPMSRELRERFQRFLEDNQHLDETSALERLLDLGLRRVEEGPSTVESEGPLDDRKAERLRTASAARRRRLRRRAMLRTVCPQNH
jgi:hypothetical protein